MSVHLLIVGGTRADRLRVADERERLHSATAERRTVDASTWPFIQPAGTAATATKRLYRIDDLEAAFSNRQVRSRLVLTQPSYLLQRWLDALGQDDCVTMTADLDRLQTVAPEVLRHRGPWRAVTIEVLPDTDRDSTTVATLLSDAPSTSAERLLADALQRSGADERLNDCRAVVERYPGSAVAALAEASACRDAGDLTGARVALDRALALGGDWAAAHFEDGKLWLAVDDLPRARDAFQRAVAAMPAFTSALSNLGAVCGELGDHAAAADYFARVLVHDPDDIGALNNIGVVNRELGRLEVSEAALQRVTALMPTFVFGHYNLGHTRFLRADFAGALVAYEEGRSRDPEKNRRQSGRLAMVRFALGDCERAREDLEQATQHAPPAEAYDILLEARDSALALIGAAPPSAAQRGFVAQIERRLKGV